MTSFWEERRRREKRTKIALIFLAIIMAVIIFAGFSEKNYYVNSCTSEVSRYWIAEFSDGESSWDEMASTVITVIKYDEPAVFPNFPSISPRAHKFKKDWYFDRFKKVTEATLYVEVSNSTEQTSFEDDIYKSRKCVDNLGELVVTNTWYGLPYSSEF